MKLPLSLVVITKNEENNIERCIKSVTFASDILVLDSDSTDGTRQAAEKAGARVIVEEWRGFGKQKQRATELAKFDWILNLDADEVLSPELCLEIEQKFNALDEKAGYEMPRKSFHMNRWINHGGWYPDRQKRLYNRKFSKWTEKEIHEKVISEREARLQSDIQHYVFENLASQIETNNRYSTLQAEEAFKNGQRFSILKLIFKPKSKFLETYILKRGFLDGLPGFVIAVGAAYSVFLRHAKIWEIQKRESKK